MTNSKKRKTRQAAQLTEPRDLVVEEASRLARAARDKFVARLREVDPSLVADFIECLHGMHAPLLAMNEQLKDEIAEVRMDAENIRAADVQPKTAMNGSQSASKTPKRTRSKS